MTIHLTDREFAALTKRAGRSRIVVMLDEAEHRAIVLAALRAKRKTHDWARVVLLAAAATGDAGRDRAEAAPTIPHSPL